MAARICLYKEVTMPELPDVEVYKQYLDATALRQRIADAHVHAPKLLGATSARELKDALAHRQLVGSRRHGKWLFAQTDAEPWLVLHFGKTGALEYYDQGPEPRHAIMTLDFENGAHLTFVDRCRLGFFVLSVVSVVFFVVCGVVPDALFLVWLC